MPRSRSLSTNEPMALRGPTNAITPAPIVLDRYRAFVFPNRIREQRQRLGLQKLMALSERLPDIPYIRLSKIERGEVVARADELHRVAQALDVAPNDLLIDRNYPAFDIAVWAQPFQDRRPSSDEEERFAIMLASALRVRRNGDAGLTIAVLDKEYGLPAVILSRLENAHRTLDRWNETTLAALCRLFGVADEGELRRVIKAQYEHGALDGFVGNITDPTLRESRMLERNDALRAELSAVRQAPHTRRSVVQITTPTPRKEDIAEVAPTIGPVDTAPATEPLRELPVFGTSIAGGLISFTPTDALVEAPRRAGPRAFALRVCRATLGAGLPASAVVVADPDRSPVAGGLATICSADGYRLVTVTFDRTGATKGYSVTPDLEFDIDELDPANVAAVIAAIYP